MSLLPLSGSQSARAVPSPLSGPWISLINPSRERLQQLASNHAIDAAMLATALDPGARARVHSHGDTLWVLSHLPCPSDEGAKVPFDVVPVGILATPTAVVAICSRNLPALAAPVSEGSHSPAALLCRLLQQGADAFQDAAQAVCQWIERDELALQDALHNRQIFKLLHNNKSLVGFASGLNANLAVLRQLLDHPQLMSDAAATLRLRDALVETEQVLAQVRIHNINLCNLMDAYSAAVENNISILVQYLSIYVVLAAIPMGLAALYGMNTPLPIQEQPWSLPLIAVIAAVLGVGAIVAFKKRNIL
ncbi:magnesium transporter CorA family protein [Isoalcanivorax beigongshangi]|uniref:Magnesium transporter CorA family protein n=1 Tax=Isoalcanivorax beigongshangi TaxID=3238810 RepID=A0ABV4AHN5_9GAMM